jgi:hypothetical protein
MSLRALLLFPATCCGSQQLLYDWLVPLYECGWLGQPHIQNESVQREQKHVCATQQMSLSLLMWVSFFKKLLWMEQGDGAAGFFFANHLLFLFYYSVSLKEGEQKVPHQWRLLMFVGEGGGRVQRLKKKVVVGF